MKHCEELKPSFLQPSVGSLNPKRILHREAARRRTVVLFTGGDHNKSFYSLAVAISHLITAWGLHLRCRRLALTLKVYYTTLLAIVIIATWVIRELQ